LIHTRRPDARFLFACLKPEHRRRAEDLVRGSDLPIEAYAGKTPEIIHVAHSCIAVSGSVGLELLYRRKPSVVVYRHNPVGLAAPRVLIRCTYLSLVNLLAGKELYPEFLTSRCEAEGMAKHILHWLEEPTSHEALRQELAALRERVAEPGACGRAAAFALEVM